MMKNMGTLKRSCAMLRSEITLFNDEGTDDECVKCPPYKGEKGFLSDSSHQAIFLPFSLSSRPNIASPKHIFIRLGGTEPGLAKNTLRNNLADKPGHLGRILLVGRRKQSGRDAAR